MQEYSLLSEPPGKPYWIKAHPNDLILNYLPLFKDSVSKYSQILRYGVRTSTYELERWGVAIQCIIGSWTKILIQIYDDGIWYCFCCLMLLWNSERFFNTFGQFQTDLGKDKIDDICWYLSSL